MDRLEQALARAEVGEGKVALLLIDIDRFKRVAGSLGQAAGDRLLQIVTERIASCLMRRSSLARIGNDEFLVLLTEFADTEVESELRHAMARGELQLYYQPIVCTRDGRIRTVKALLRWNSPELGWVSPAEFIPVAEESGQIVAIGEYVLATACRQVRHWRETGLPPVRVAVNVSAHQLANGHLPARIQHILDETGIGPEQLEIELTESAMMVDTDQSADQVELISRMGVSVSLDDFGTGYSSLAYLSRFAITKLKIDRSFVAGLATDAKSSIIVDATVGLARSLGLRVVAEGVETEAQKTALAAAGCDALQGYLFSPPVPPAALGALINRFAPAERYATPRVVAGGA
jgi:predicted signal transduction protein with EAL and GGDEF domain